MNCFQYHTFVLTKTFGIENRAKFYQAVAPSSMTYRSYGTIHSTYKSAGWGYTSIVYKYTVGVVPAVFPGDENSIMIELLSI